MKLNQTVKIKNVSEVERDQFLDSTALAIIRKSNYQGTITKIEDGIHFVGFKNESGWVTQGYKSNEIEVVK